MVRNEPPAEVKERSLPASLDYAEIRIHAAAKLFGSHEDDPGLVRISGTVIVPDLHDEDEESISSIEGIGLEVANGATAEITILRAEAVVLDLGRIKYLFETLERIRRSCCAIVVCLTLRAEKVRHGRRWHQGWLNDFGGLTSFEPDLVAPMLAGVPR